MPWLPFARGRFRRETRAPIERSQLRQLTSRNRHRFKTIDTGTCHLDHLSGRSALVKGALRGGFATCGCPPAHPFLKQQRAPGPGSCCLLVAPRQNNFQQIGTANQYSCKAGYTQTAPFSSRVSVAT